MKWLEPDLDITIASCKKMSERISDYDLPGICGQLYRDWLPLACSSDGEARASRSIAKHILQSAIVSWPYRSDELMFPVKASPEDERPHEAYHTLPRWTDSYYGDARRALARHIADYVEGLKEDLLDRSNWEELLGIISVLEQSLLRGILPLNGLCDNLRLSTGKGRKFREALLKGCLHRYPGFSGNTRYPVSHPLLKTPRRLT